MLTKAELLQTLEREHIKYARVAEALDLPSSRVTEIFRAIKPSDGKPVRELTYDEGVKLIRAFGLDDSPKAEPLPLSILQLIARHVALKLQAPTTEDQIAEIAKDLRAFSEYAANRQRTVEAAEGFLDALFRRPANDTGVPPESDPGTDSERTH
jgi:hypothetical protein